MEGETEEAEESENEEVELGACVIMSSPLSSVNAGDRLGFEGK